MTRYFLIFNLFVILSFAVKAQNRPIAIVSLGNSDDCMDDVGLTYCVDHNYPVTSFSTFSPDQRFLVIAGAGLKVYNIRDDSLVFLGLLKDYRKFIYSVSFSPDSRLLAAGSYKNLSIYYVRDDSLVLLKRLKQPRGYIYSVSFSPDGKYLVAGGYSLVNVYAVEDTSVTFIKTLKSPFGEIFSIKFSPNGKLLMVSSYTQAYFYSVPDNFSYIRSIHKPRKYLFNRKLLDDY